MSEHFDSCAYALACLVAALFQLFQDVVCSVAYGYGVLVRHV
jgi:hypothetical protein